MATTGHVQKASYSGQKLNESASTRQPRIVLLGQHRAAEGGDLYHF